jgi:hypothetical protein
MVKRESLDENAVKKSYKPKFEIDNSTLFYTGLEEVSMVLENNKCVHNDIQYDLTQIYKSQLSNEVEKAKTFYWKE